MIQQTTSKLHWNYFLALERDMEVVSRYIEFAEANYDVYSIELARLLFASASEVEVVAKLICKKVSPNASPQKINEWRPILLQALPDLPQTKVFVPRYGLELTPWTNWATPSVNPCWWGSYNHVKHDRDTCFAEATLKHALNSLSALLILNFHYYRLILGPSGTAMSPQDTLNDLEPESVLLRLQEDHYPAVLRVR